MTGLPECFTKKQQIYHGNKSQLSKLFDSTRYLTSTLKKDAVIPDFLEIVNLSRQLLPLPKLSTNLQVELLNFSTICRLVVQALT